MSVTNRIIWVVEDDPFYGKWLTNKIKNDMGFKVELFNNGEAAIEAMKAIPSQLEAETLPDLMLVDYHLTGDAEGMNGLGVLSSFRKAHPRIPVIVVSGQDDVSTAATLIRKGAWDYMVKNDIQTAEYLSNTITSVLDTVEYQQELQKTRRKALRTKVGMAFSILLVVGLIAASFLW